MGEIHYTEQDQERILALAAPALIPMLKHKQETLLRRIQGDYRNGATEFRPAIAEYTLLSEMIRDIEIKLNNYKLRGQ